MNKIYDEQQVSLYTTRNLIHRSHVHMFTLKNFVVLRNLSVLLQMQHNRSYFLHTCMVLLYVCALCGIPQLCVLDSSGHDTAEGDIFGDKN